MIARDTLVLPGKSPAKPYCLIHEGEEIPEELRHHVTNPDAFIPKEEYEAQAATEEQPPTEEPTPEEQVEEPAVEEEEEDSQEEEPQGEESEDDGLLPTGKKTTRKRPASRAKK